MIHTDNQPVKPITPEEFERHIAHLNRAYVPIDDIPPSIREWMKAQDEARDPANALRYAAA